MKLIARRTGGPQDATCIHELTDWAKFEGRSRAVLGCRRSQSSSSEEDRSSVWTSCEGSRSIGGLPDGGRPRDGEQVGNVADAAKGSVKSCSKTPALAAERAGRLITAKVDTDTLPDVAGRFGIRPSLR
jgi:hypothetical protein